jgi:outer membrane protein assembly factor BamB
MAAAAALLVAVVAGALLLRDDTVPAGPRVVAQLDLTGNPAQILPAFGAVWISDPVAGALVRVDPERRTVTARVPVGTSQQLFVAPVGRELWAIGAQPDQLLRIDPATNRVAGTVALRDPGGRRFHALDVIANDRAVWAVSAEGALQLDPRTGAAIRLVAPPRGGNEARWATLGDDTLWIYDTDGTIRRFDAATGAPTGRLRPALPGTQIVGDLGGDLVGTDGNGRVARMDGTTGAIAWQRIVGERIHAGDFGGGLLWQFATAPSRPARLVALDPRDGAVVSSTDLPVFGATGLAVVDREVWISDAAGRTLVVGR